LGEGKPQSGVRNGPLSPGEEIKGVREVAKRAYIFDFTKNVTDFLPYHL
jgi:hypothetical protein